MNALKVADEISAKDNIFVSYVFGGSPEQKDFINVKHKDFLRAYQKGKMVKNADANKVDTKAQTFVNDKAVNKNKGAEDIKIEIPKKAPTTEEESSLRFAETPEEKAFVKEVQAKCAKVVDTVKAAGLDISPLVNTITKAGKKIKAYNTAKIRKLQPIFGDSLEEELDKETKETLSTELIFPAEEIE